MSTNARSRKERDSIGIIEVPLQAPYGAQTARAAENFQISGRKAHPALSRAYLRLKRAAAIANMETQALPSQLARKIVRAADAILNMDEEKWNEFFVVDAYQAGAGTSQNMNYNEVIAHFADRRNSGGRNTATRVHPNDHVNRSQSTNDTYPTAIRLALLDASSNFIVELRAAAASFNSKAKLWKNIPKSARTHLQDAVPITLGQEFAAYGAALKRCADWLESSRNGLRELGIGGSAAGTGLNVPNGYTRIVIRELSRMTHERLRAAPDLREAMQSQAPVMHYSSMLRLTALELTRICNDLRLLASGPMTGLAEIQLPAVQPGSSIMPGKVNPSMIEMANQTWYSMLGYDQTVAYCMQAGQLELNVMMPMMAYSLLEATEVGTRALRALRLRCLDGIEPNREKCRRYFEATPQVATALSPKLGYEATAALVKEALATGQSVVELVRERKLMTERELTQLLDPSKLVGKS